MSTRQTKLAAWNERTQLGHCQYYRYQPRASICEHRRSIRKKGKLEKSSFYFCIERTYHGKQIMRLTDRMDMKWTWNYTIEKNHEKDDKGAEKRLPQDRSSDSLIGLWFLAEKYCDIMFKKKGFCTSKFWRGNFAWPGLCGRCGTACQDAWCSNPVTEDYVRWRQSFWSGDQQKQHANI